MICVQRTIQNNLNNRFFCFLIPSKSNSQIIVYMKDLAWQNLPNCFTLDYTIQHVNSRLLYVWIMSCRNRSAKTSCLLLSLSLSLSFLRFSRERAFSRCFLFLALSLFFFSSPSSEHRNRDNCDALNHRRRRQKKAVIPGRIRFFFSKKKQTRDE